MKKVMLGITLMFLMTYSCVRGGIIYDEYTTTDPLHRRFMGVNVMQFLNHHHDVKSLTNALRRIRGVMLALTNGSGVKFLGKKIEEKTGDRLNWRSADALYRVDHPETLPKEVPDTEIVVYVDESDVVIDFKLPASLLVSALFPKLSHRTQIKLYWDREDKRGEIVKKFKALERNFQKYLENYSQLHPLVALVTKAYTPEEIVRLSSHAAFDQMLLELEELYYSKASLPSALATVQHRMFLQSQNWMTKYLKACKNLHPAYFFWLQIQPFCGMGMALLLIPLLIIQLRRQDLFEVVHGVLAEKLQSTPMLEMMFLNFCVICAHPRLLIWQPPDDQLCVLIAPSCSEVVHEYHTRKQLRAIAKEAQKLAAVLKERFHDNVPKSLAGLLEVALSKARAISVREDALKQLRRQLQLRTSRNGKNGHSTLPTSILDEIHKNGIPEAERIRKEVIQRILAGCRESAPESCTHIGANFFESFSRRKLEMYERVVRFLADAPTVLQQFLELSQAQMKGLMNESSAFMNAVLSEDLEATQALLDSPSNGNQTFEVTPSQLEEDVSHFLAGKRVVIFGGARTHIPDIQNRLVKVILQLGAASCEFRYCNDYKRMFSSMHSQANIWIMLIGTVPHRVKEQLASERHTELLINVRHVNAERFRNEVVQKIKQAENSQN